MKAQGKTTHDELRAKRLEVHFLFGFLFSRLDFGSIAAKAEDRISRGALEADILTAIKKERHFRHTFHVDTNSIRFRTDAPEGDPDHNVIQYYVLIDNPYLAMESKALPVDIVEVDAETSKRTPWRRASVIKSIRLYESGMGLYRVTIRVGRLNSDSQLSAEDIISVADAGSSERELQVPIGDKKILQFQRDNRAYDLFREYYKDVSGLRTVISTGLAGAYENTMAGHMYKTLSWIDVDRHIVAFDQHVRGCPPFQNPYVFQHIELPQPLFNRIPGCEDTFDTLRDHDEKGLSLLSADVQNIVLRRVEAGRTSPHYVQKYTQSLGDVLANMCVSSRAFVNLHIRSSVYISADSVDARKYSKSVLPILIDTLELMRMRWYAYVMLNRYLDVQVSELCQQFHLICKQDDITTIDRNLEECQKSIIRVKSEILRVLELPLSYRRASATATTVYDVGEHIFDIKELQDIVIQKVNCLDRLFRNVNDMRQRSEFDRMEPEITKLIGLDVDTKRG